MASLLELVGLPELGQPQTAGEDVARALPEVEQGVHGGVHSELEAICNTRTCVVTYMRRSRTAKPTQQQGLVTCVDIDILRVLVPC